MSSLPWWAKLAISSAVSLLASIVSKLTGVPITDEVKQMIIDFIMHLIGADNPQAALKSIREAHACAGIGCVSTTKTL